MLEKVEDMGMALLERAAGQGHAHAMYTLGSLQLDRKEH